MKNKQKKMTNQLQLELEQSDKIINRLMYNSKELYKRTIKQIIKDTER